MSNVHDAQTIAHLAGALAKFIDNNEKVSLHMFSGKLARAQQEYPSDYTIGMLNRVVSKMASSDKLFISKAEIKDLYNKFYSKDNRFVEIFASEVGYVAPEQKVSETVSETSILDLIQAETDKMVDPVLASALNRAMGSEDVKVCNASLEKAVLAACNSAFDVHGFKSFASVRCGKDGFVICTASFETPRGSTSVLVPVEVDGHKVSYKPSIFICNAGSFDITRSNLTSYLTSRAGEKLEISPQEALEAVTIAADSADGVSDVELAVTRLNASKEATESLPVASYVLGVEMPEANVNLLLDLPKVQDERFESIARSFDSERGYATSVFGADAVNQGRSFVAAKLRDASIRTANIAVHSTENDSITYSVSLNGGASGFLVPVKVEAGNVFPPSVLLCNGSIASFDEETIAAMLKEFSFDRAALVSASSFSGMRPSALVEEVRSAMEESDYVKAEDALNVLANCDDEKAYQSALKLFNTGLKPVIAEPEEIGCSKIIRTANSQHDICSHTNLPVHKTFRDKHGNCLPLYRQKMATSSEGAILLNHKILF